MLRLGINFIAIWCVAYTLGQRFASLAQQSFDTSPDHELASRVLSTTSEIAPNELNSLFDMYTSMNGAEWLWSNKTNLPGLPWNFTDGSDPCIDVWQGIRCNDTFADGYAHVVAIDLAVMFMKGRLPNSIGEFRKLEKLVLVDNAISGTLPASIGNFTDLVWLDIGTNDFSGSLPPTLGNLQSLVELGISTNYFTGPIPNLSNLTNLFALALEDNILDGPLPPWLCNLTELEFLIVYYNEFTGSISESIGDLTHLRRFVAGNNFLSGTLPSSLGGLTNLTRLEVNSNHLYGRIPSSLGELRNLQYLYVYSNAFTGPLPDSVGGMSSLTTASLQSNVLTGTLPMSLCNITTLSALRAFNNLLTGTLPACLTLNAAFSVLVLYNNQMSGPLPPLYAVNSTLNFLDLNGPNFFTGTLPETWGALQDLGSIYLSGNLFTGTIPAYVGDMAELVTFYVDFNRFSGPLPAVVGQLPNLLLFEVSGNHISGSLPPSWGNLINLQELHVDTNYLTGTIPDTYTQLEELQVLNIFSNLLYGPIPQEIGNLGQLRYLGFDTNQLTGTIPDSIGRLGHLEDCELHNNHLTGTLPLTLSSLTSVINLLVQNNHLSGTLDGALSSVVQRSLVVVQLSDNQFSGTIPDEAFRMPSLTTFAAVSNCFDGSLPRSACDSTTLEVLALSGLQSARVCQQRILPGLAQSYLIKSPISGGIPPCLFQVPTLTTLQLSGNGLTGTLPEDIAISPTLRDLSLSHNSLSGTVPTSFQQRAWVNFDLSYNRFRGELNENIETQTSPVYNASYEGAALSLESNRLSGRIPDAVKSFVNISLLSGNLFVCSATEKDLPSHDPAASNYECGSTSFEVPYFVWICIVGVTVAVVIWYIRTAKDEVSASRTGLCGVDGLRRLQRWYLMLRHFEGVDASLFPMLNLRYVSALYNSVAKISAAAAAYAVVVLLPLYAGLSVRYATVDNQYAYTVAAAFYSGATALALEMVFLILLQCLVVLCCVRYWQEPDARVVQQAHRSVTQSSEVAKSSLLHRTAVYCVLLVTNTTVVVGANVAYVYVALYQSSGLLLFAQIVLSVFKLGWNKFCGSSLIPLTALYVAPSVNTDLRASTVEFFPLQLFLSLFNNIVIPCVVVMVVSPNCFNYVFTHSPSVNSQYVVNQCVKVDDVTAQCETYYEQTEVTSFNPPFTYSYQCSAAFVTYYAPAFVIMSIMSTFGIPVLQTVLVLLHQRAAAEGARTGRFSWWFRALDVVVPSLLKSPGSVYADTAAQGSPTSAMRWSMMDLGRWTTVQRNIYSPLFPANQVLLNMLTFLGILLTFGAVFPPLAVTLSVTVLGVALYARLKVGRFLTAAVETKQYRFFDLVDQECRGVGTLDVLLRSAFMVLSFSCAFYTLFLFDTLGDQYGLAGAYWVLIVMPLVPAVLYAAFELYKWRAPGRFGQRTDSAAWATGAMRPATAELVSPATAMQLGSGTAEASKTEGQDTFSALHDDQL